MNSTIIDKVHSSFYTVLNAYYDAYENYYGGDTPKDNRSELRLVVDGKGVSITEHGYLIDNLEAPLPRIDLTTDKLRLELQTTLILDYTEQYDLGDTDYALSSRFYVYRPIASGVGLDSLINDLQTATTTTLGIRIGEEDLEVVRV
jgi:hypothetical protein